MSARSPLSVPQRVAVWDAALGAVRAVLRGEGLCEVVTPVRLRAVAIEPYIEPVPAPPGYLATSPELPMKRLLGRGGPSIFQIAPCFRAAERGALHREEFRLVEWYRVGADTPALLRDVERLVGAVFEAVAGVLDEPPMGSPTEPPMEPPRRFARVGLLPLVEQTLGVRLRGDEDAVALRAALADVSVDLGDPLATPTDARLATSPRARTLAAWTAFFSAWSDVCLDAWLAAWLAAHPQQGVHVVDFPPPLAALSEVGPGADGRPVAHRFESHVHGCELANGYRELRDPDEQRRRFEDVGALRAALGGPPLPLDEGFLADLRGLPPCAGAALGLDRLVLLATGRRRLADVVIELSAVGSDDGSPDGSPGR
ncbi:MAG: amino acid--tRNA ligase-related protein [Myxococcota bacterium]